MGDFLGREKRTLKGEIKKLGFYPSSADRFPRIKSPLKARFLFYEINSKEVYTCVLGLFL